MQAKVGCYHIFFSSRFQYIQFVIESIIICLLRKVSWKLLVFYESEKQTNLLLNPITLPGAINLISLARDVHQSRKKTSKCHYTFCVNFVTANAKLVIA